MVGIHKWGLMIDEDYSWEKKDPDTLWMGMGEHWRWEQQIDIYTEYTDKLNHYLLV